MLKFTDRPWFKLFLIVIFLFSFWSIFKLATRERVIIIENPLLQGETTVSAESVNDLPEIVNAFFLGLPGENNSAPNLTDAIMVLSLNRRTGQGLLVSIPRDLLVKLPDSNSYIKINSLYQRTNIETVQKLLTEITGLDFDYRLAINLDGVQEVIDQIDGIDIFVKQDIYDPSFPSTDQSTEVFSLTKGWQHLDGQTALKYIRTRHTPRGDFDRMAHQQKLLLALKEKIASLHPFWDLPIILDLWQILNKNVTSNLSVFNVKNFWRTFKDLDLAGLNFKVLNTETGLVRPDSIILGGQMAYVLKPSIGLEDYSAIQDYLKEFLPN